jgi:hypothetical protein
MRSPEGWPEISRVWSEATRPEFIEPKNPHLEEVRGQLGQLCLTLPSAPILEVGIPLILEFADL